MSTDIKGVVFNIQRFSLHDGTGIRTLVFLKGCPLRCMWCANPEGQSGSIEIGYNKNKCIGCGACIASCKKHAVTHNSVTGFTINRALCDGCRHCVKVCPACAKYECGEYMSASDVANIAKRDAYFYNHSEGGVTIGGGEVLFQPAFTWELLRKCKELHLDTAIETSGYGGWSWLERIAHYCDTIFYDLKVVDLQKHSHLTGANNALIMANLKALDQMIGSKANDKNRRLIIRVPIIPDLNSDMASMENMGCFIKSTLRNISGVELLPFHNLCEQKYEQLGMSYPLKGMASLKEEQVTPLKQVLTEMGLTCTITSW